MGKTLSPYFVFITIADTLLNQIKSAIKEGDDDAIFELLILSGFEEEYLDKNGLPKTINDRGEETALRNTLEKNYRLNPDELGSPWNYALIRMNLKLFLPQVLFKRMILTQRYDCTKTIFLPNASEVSVDNYEQNETRHLTDYFLSGNTDLFDITIKNDENENFITHQMAVNSATETDRSSSNNNLFQSRDRFYPPRRSDGRNPVIQNLSSAPPQNTSTQMQNISRYRGRNPVIQSMIQQMRRQQNSPASEFKVIFSSDDWTASNEAINFFRHNGFNANLDSPGHPMLGGELTVTRNRQTMSLNGS